MDQNDKNKSNKNNDRRKGVLSLLIWALVLTIGFNYLLSAMDTRKLAESTCEIRYDEFLDLVRDGKVKEVEIADRTLNITPVDGFTYTDADGKTYSGDFQLFTTQINDPELRSFLDENGVEFGKPYKAETSYLEIIMLNYVLPTALMVGAFILMMRFISKKTGGGGFGGLGSVGKSNAKVYMEKSTGVTFADVAGQDEAKESLVEIIDFLHNPQKYTDIGAKLPRGALLVGPPGTGKTLLAKAVAGEANVPFFSISGSGFVEMFVGVGASRVRDLFAEASKVAPCIIFIDEIDAVGRKRGAGLGGGHDEREQTLNQLLVEMDGFESNEGVILLAATNRPDVLDPALLRPGRFDRQVVVPTPDLRGRRRILEVHTKRTPLDPDVDLDTLARGTPGFSGADLENLVNEAALQAAKLNATKVDMHDFEYAKDKVLMGRERRSLILSDEEKRITAYHEGGHALAARLLPGSDPVHKVTIIPRGRALGLTMQLPEEDRHGYSRNYLRNNLVVLLGGRVAEEIVFDDITTGASNDIERVTRMARKMVCEWGMSDAIGTLSIGETGEEVFIGREWVQNKNYSEETARLVDAEVKRIVEEAHARCVKLLQDNRAALDRIAQALLERETISGEELDLLMENKPLLPLDANGKPVKAAPAGDFVLEPDPADTDAAAPEADKAAEPAPEKAEQGDGDTGNRTQDNDENEQRKQ